MKKMIMCLTALAMVSAVLAAQPSIPADWDKKVPRNTKEFLFQIGMSDVRSSEKDAADQAWMDALSKLASSVSALYTGETEHFSIEEGMESEVLDAYSFTISSSSWKSTVPLLGVKLLDKKVRRKDGGYEVSMLVYMTAEDYEKSRIAVLDEESSVFAYRFFEQQAAESAQRNGGGTAFHAIREKGETYFQWLRMNCIVLHHSEKKDGKEWGALYANYLSKAFRHIIIYCCPIEGVDSVVVYNTPDYFGKVVSALNSTALFSIQRKGSVISLSPKKTISTFQKYVDGMKDSGKISVCGTEMFSLPSGDVVSNSGGRVIKAFCQLAEKHLGLACSMSALSFGSSDEMISYASSHSDKYIARYTAFVSSQTQCNEGDSKYGIKPMADASVTVTLYDLETGERYISCTAESTPGAFPLTEMTDRYAAAQSRNALDNIANPDKNPEGLLYIMQKLFAEID